MRVPAAQARAINRGKKTALRVPVSPRLTERPLRPARRHSGRPFNPTVGDIIPIDGADRTYCKITALQRGPLGTLTPQDATDEGYPTTAEFEIDWVEQHERAWLDRQVSYLVEQGIPQQEADDTRDSWAKVRYDQYWAPREVWVLTVEAFNDMPYLLEGLPEEPEAIPLDRLQTRWATRAGRRYQQANDEELRFREAKQLARRVKLMKLNNPDAPEIVVIEQQLAELEARHSQAA
jgi:hypothetical protein